MRLSAGIGNAGADDRVIAEGHDHARLVSGMQQRQRLDVEMVVMVMRDQHSVDLRQVGEGDARRIHALRTDEGEGAGA